MCGICGIFDPESRLRPISEMNDSLRHRGPDDEGYLFARTESGTYRQAGGPDTHPSLSFPGCHSVEVSRYDLALGSRRLAILDLSSAGHMPMTVDGERWLIYNGEVYNYKEIQAELQQLGYSFRSHSDTEVILAAYAEWGTECLSRFNGMFSFAIWDATRNRLFCARDRFGIKPFYYFWDGSTFVFASEIKALLRHPVVPAEPREAAVYDYLILGVSDHSEMTFFRQIQALPAGHFLLFDTRERQLRLEQWWRLKAQCQVGLGAPDKQPEVRQQFRELLTDAVRLRLRSDVPVGTCLSGGLDSSAIVCLCNSLMREEHVIHPGAIGDHQKTFTARNSEPEIDEYRFSRQIVDLTGAEENLVYPTPEVLWQEVESFIWQLDEPVDSTSQYPQWNVMRLARDRGVRVLLDGQGGDELLAGYHTYFPPYLDEVYSRHGAVATLSAAMDFARVGGRPARDCLRSYAYRKLPWRLQRVLATLQPRRTPPGTGGSGLKAWQISPLLLWKFQNRALPAAATNGAGPLTKALHNDLSVTNLPKLLRYEDRNAMTFSIEARLPFLDFRLVEFVFSLPSSYRINEGWTKRILRDSLNDILPKEVCWRKSKLGFPVPELKWLRAGAGRIRQVLGSPAVRELDRYLDPQALMRIRELPDEELAAVPGLWRIVNLVVWFEMYFRGTRSADVSSAQGPRASRPLVQ